MPLSQPSVYLFGIVRANARLHGSDVVATVGAAEFGPLRMLTDGELSAIVSDLSLPEGTTLDMLLQEPKQVEALVLHHHQVLEDVAGQVAALPLRFGSLFSNDDGVRETLVSGHECFLRSINDIDGAVEWGLKVFCNRSRLAERLRNENPEIAEFQAKVSGASEGKRFFLERRLERLIDDEVGHAIARCLDQTTRLIAPRCRRFAKAKVRSAQHDGQEAEMVFNGAFLIDRGREDGFSAAVDDLRLAYADFGFDYKTTGPWPAYSFVEGKLKEEGNAV